MKEKKKKKPAVIPVIVALSILLIALAAGLFILYMTPENTPQPVYEEDYVSSNKFKSIIIKVDHIVYETLYKEGVKEEDISFSSVIPKYEKKLEWDFTELTVRVNNPDLINNFEAFISEKISALLPEVSVESESISDDEVIFE